PTAANSGQQGLRVAERGDGPVWRRQGCAMLYPVVYRFRFGCWHRRRPSDRRGPPRGLVPSVLRQGSSTESLARSRAESTEPETDVEDAVLMGGGDPSLGPARRSLSACTPFEHRLLTAKRSRQETVV